MRGISTAVAVAVLALPQPRRRRPRTPAPRCGSTGRSRSSSVASLSVPGERVSLTAMTLLGARQVVVRATRAGRFAATFRLPTQSCGSTFALRAVGALGSRATLRLPGPRLRAAADPLSRGERRRAGSPPPVASYRGDVGRYFGGVTSICMKPPGVRLLMRIDVPVCGWFTLLHSDW